MRGHEQQLLEIQHYLLFLLCYLLDRKTTLQLLLQEERYLLQEPRISLDQLLQADLKQVASPH